MQKQKVNLAGIDTIEEFANYVKIHNIKPDIYPKIKSDGTIIEFLYTVSGHVTLIEYNKNHSYYDVALKRANKSEHTCIEGV